MKQTITRFPPSPTGYLHVGGARTAVFNWLYARHTNGKMIFRLEDTDRIRSTQEFVDAIIDALEWLGIDWDEGPFFQTQRFDTYREHIEKLLNSGHAYYCTCPPERLEEMRKSALETGGKPKYDGTCREKNLPPSANAVIRFKAPMAGTTTVPDVVKGHIVFQNHELDDFILVRSDGSPTYNFVVVVDDITMKVNTIIRGDDHVMNTPKQILIYQALGAPLPVFAHVPMVLGKDRARLSKRHGAMSVTAYREMGYLPDALINYLVRLGWSHGDQEFFTRKELIEKFSLESIGKSAGIFDPEKLLALNAEHIRAASPEELTTHLLPFLKKRGVSTESGPPLAKVISTLAVRSKTLVEMADGALFYYKEKIEYDPKAAEKFLGRESIEPMKMAAEGIEALPDLSQSTQEEMFKQIMEKTGLKFGKIAQPLRVALTGGTVSPGIFEIIEVLGKKETVKRLNAAISYTEQWR